MEKICEICSPGQGERQGNIYDASGKSVIPGFIDVHTHGGCGVDVNDALKDDFEKSVISLRFKGQPHGFVLF